MGDTYTAYVVYRHKGCYYSEFKDSLKGPDAYYYTGFGKTLVADIPAEASKYRAWLEEKRLFFSNIQRDLEELIYEIEKDEWDDSNDDYHDHFRYCEVPSALPVTTTKEPSTTSHVYILNLDREVFTVDFGIHFPLNNIPREKDMWIEACTSSIYCGLLTVDASVCPEECMASPAVALRAPIRELPGYAFDMVTPTIGLQECGPTFLTFWLARTIQTYENRIKRYAREWESTDFPFREFIYAMVSLAGNKAQFRPIPLPGDLEREAVAWGDEHDIEKEWLGIGRPVADELGALPAFGYLFHRPGQDPGAAPLVEIGTEDEDDDKDKDQVENEEDNGKQKQNHQESMYWLEENVLVFPTLVPNGASLSKAVTYGLTEKKEKDKKCCPHFHIVAISMFEVAFAEVCIATDGKVSVRATEPVFFSPLRPEFCHSSHPRERPARQKGLDCDEGYVKREGETDLQNKLCVGPTGRLSKYFPGFAALTNFLDVAAARRAALYRCSASYGLPQEIYDHILHFADANTWRTCLGTSYELHAAARRAARYRIDDVVDIVDGPWMRKPDLQRVFHNRFATPTLSFGIRERSAGDDMDDTPVVPVWVAPYHLSPFELTLDPAYNWIPVIGQGERMVAMTSVVVEFEFAGPEVPAANDDDDDVDETDFCELD